jgi:GNAT superfamily N-acetyltransferase
MIQIKQTQLLTPEQQATIHQLWNDEYPLKLKDRFPLLLEGTVSFNHYLIEDESGKVIAWAVDFVKEDEQKRFSIIVSSHYKGKGIGAALINRLKGENSEFYGWVIDHNEDLKSDGTFYRTPMPFYLKHGFEILPDKRIDTEMIRAVLVKWIKQK